MTIASQDFRDGAATGATRLADRLSKLSQWGVRIDHTIITNLAQGLVYEMGGTVYPDGPSEADLWDDGFTACAEQFTQQRKDPEHPITRLNPHRPGGDPR